jgi:hypothetical protein
MEINNRGVADSARRMPEAGSHFLEKMLYLTDLEERDQKAKIASMLTRIGKQQLLYAILRSEGDVS